MPETRRAFDVCVRRRHGGAVATTVVGMLTVLAGCIRPARPPVTPAAMEQAGPAARRRWGKEKIALYNLRRVQDERLDPAARLASLAVVLDEVGADPWYLSELATILSAGRAPAPVRRAVLGVLAAQDDPQAEPYVLDALGASEPGVVQGALLDWLTRHPHRTWLADVVCRWARADGADDAAEERFRRAVETMSARAWSEALLDGLNRPGFTARRSALAVLESRLDDDVLKRRIASLEPRTTAVEALQYLLAEADYLPSADDLLTTVETYVARREQLDDALEVARAWTAAGDYTFSLRDVHLLAGLADADEALRSGRRGPLLSRLDARLRARARRAAVPIADAGAATPLETLSTAALVRLDLLGAMLERRRIAGGLARRCRRAGASWGGLVVLDGGGATPRLY
ncbi:MAG: hypothetical protein ACOC7R_03655, partial [Planctomycetota bacterium]